MIILGGFFLLLYLDILHEPLKGNDFYVSKNNFLEKEFSIAIFLVAAIAQKAKILSIMLI